MTISTPKKSFLSERELRKALRGTLTRAAWLGPGNFWLVRSEHAHASYPGLFFRPPGFSTYIGREESRVQGLDYRNGGLIMRYARTSFGWFVYIWASTKFFGISLLRKQGLPCLLWGSLANSFSALYAMCGEGLWKTMSGEGLWKNCVFVLKFLVSRGEIKFSETFLMLILSEKRLILHQNITVHQLSISDEKMLLLTE